MAIAQVGGSLRDEPGRLMPARWAIDLRIASPASTPAESTATATSLRADLGNVIARLLLSNDSRSGDQAEALVAELAQQLTEGAKATSGAAQVHEAAESLIRGSQIATGADVVHAKTVRQRVGIELPATIWTTLMKLLLRLQTAVDGFSFSTSPLLDLCGELTALGKHLDIATFGAIARRDEISAAVRQQLNQRTP